jgi:predicted glutamine amidotransferase
MCRLLGWTGPAQRSAAAALGDEGFDALVELGHFHRDGWGYAWRPARPDGVALQAVHATTSAAEDPEFRRMGAVPTDGGIAHLRWATPGMAIVDANCHPFVRGSLAMAHNGGIYPLDRLDAILPPQREADLVGTTDSERYLALVQAGIEDRDLPLVDAITAAVEQLSTGWSISSLNSLWLTPDELVAVCAFNPDLPPDSLPEPPAAYYRLSWRSEEAGTVVASSGVPQAASAGWTAMDNMSMLVIPRSEKAPEVRPLDAPVPRVQPATGDVPVTDGR